MSVEINKKTHFIYESEVFGFFNRLGTNLRTVVTGKELQEQKKELRKAIKYYIDSEV